MNQVWNLLPQHCWRMSRSQTRGCVDTVRGGAVVFLLFAETRLASKVVDRTSPEMLGPSQQAAV
jgi:hypothetical protein